MTVPALLLHGYWRSSAAYRVRLALNWKGLDYGQVAHDLRAGTQFDEAYRAIAPAGLVPALEVAGVALVQSGAIVEYLEERWPEPPLLPSRAEERAAVRAMAATIACDIHPLNNLRVLKSLKHDLHAGDEQRDAWIARWIGAGFAALEAMVTRHGGGFAFGDTVTMADCFLVPQLYNAERYGVDLAPYPRLVAAGERARALPAFAAAHPDRQPDATPQ